MLSRRGLCDGPIPHIEESYGVSVSVCVCMCMCVIQFD
jgi:hypothetical protein